MSISPDSSRPVLLNGFILKDGIVKLRFAVFSDAEKQNTMNVFLGVFRPEASRPAIWEKEYNSDYYLHHQVQSWGPSHFGTEPDSDPRIHISVAGPDPNPDQDPPDSHVFGPPESGFRIH